MNVSVVCTVLNEEKTIAPLLDSLLTQTIAPKEIIIVDGGSKDHTQAIIRSYQEKNDHIYLVVKKGNVAVGRNTAIAEAEYPIIAQIDGGCIAKADWLEKLTAPFENKETQVVAGFYEITCNSALSCAVAPFTGTTKRRYDQRSFMPSARSMAMRRSVWEAVGGYSEALGRAAEDTLFNYHLLLHHIEIVRVPEAIVYWEAPRSLGAMYRKFYQYAKSDVQTGIWWHPARRFSTHNIKVLTIFARYFVFGMTFSLSLWYPMFSSIALTIFGLYLLWSLVKLREDVEDFGALILVPVVQVFSDVTVMAGFIAGLLQLGDTPSENHEHKVQ